ncbi:hypothetical protein [Streptosporangium sp. LJ11]|uniref:hypothetical protein n=1 Tax=Streptosporangium sp. LJ11 TaxID=3436927 RepID=UPI003F7A725B
MLLWINGPFGGGKTQTAHELRRRLPGSVVCDPEHVGFGHAMQYVAGKGAPLRRESFAVSRLDRCLERLREAEFAEHVWTDLLTIPQVADHIAASSGLALAPNTDGALRGRLRRAWTGVKHIRFG